MSLGQVIKCPPVVWLVPQSGVQFIDLGFTMARSKELPTQWSFYDDPASHPSPLLVARGDAPPSGRVTYEVDWRRVVETLDRVWVPLPMFRREKAGGHEQGPINWARAYLARLNEPDQDGYDHRLVIAFDTDLAPRSADTAYLAPAPEDAQRGAEFSLAANPEKLSWFAQQNWVTAWCRSAFTDMIQREERARSRIEPVLTEAMIAERLEGPREDVARYLALIDLIDALKILPSFRFVDRYTRPLATPIDVDLVLDVGNSRTCGLLIETHPDQLSADVTQAVKLAMRDLSQPENVDTLPFDSRLEFNKASFGADDISFLSGRSDAFSWPTVARVGTEAQRLSSQRRGSEGATGMSSPKRYLWDEDARRDGWRFNGPIGKPDQSGYATGVEFTTLINDLGEPLYSVPEGVPAHDDARFPSIRALYARSHLMTIALSEIFLHTFSMMNAPAHRLRRRNADLPRRLRRIIMTMPTAMPLAERQILRKRATAARDLVFLCLGLARIEPRGTDGSGEVVAVEGATLPDIVIEWDEASATQAAYLYSQIGIAYQGDARSFFSRSRLPVNRADPEAGNSFRLATLDIGGGTTDLVVTAYRVEGQGANVTLFPEQVLREGISVAGDDVVFQIVLDHVLEPIRKALNALGLGPRTDYLMHRLFGGDRGDMDVEEQLRRQQFAAHIGAPIALKMIEAYENWDPLSGEDRLEPLSLDSVFGHGLNKSLVAAIDGEIRKHGAPDFSLASVSFPVDLKDIDRTARSVLIDVLQAFAELVRRSEADLLILSGRPSRLPAAFGLLAETSALPPHRIVPLHEFRVGPWYPFRDFESRIADPKTTAAVGAMICLLGEGRLRDFNYRSDHLRPRSTARYFGKLDTDNRLREDNVIYRELDLDNPDYELPETGFEFRGPLTLGFRQFGVDWWPGSRLYWLDYATPEAAATLNPRTPLKVEMQRAKGRESKEIVDAFTIRRIEDAQGRTISSNQLRLRLQTIDNAQGYWLDSGILLKS
ncbi:hypothetical protein SAMN07250955_101503 [Arboricoccus pini]|uniref:Virulence factor SrfB n=1 Tax=Arboricoccus pini TaxID=1963835 RepID=A0A212Q8Y5_9PROT|nr:virulence factor SrfB [Arboricoccus pini]SNB55848.1 hypothetical protein SAMN07250955_101503 [Arboricoccus pini]